MLIKTRLGKNPATNNILLNKSSIVRLSLSAIMTMFLLLSSSAYAANSDKFDPTNLSANDTTGDSVFDDSVIFGTVYVDENNNGLQDAGEAGLGGVRLVTAKGQILITDHNGRFHIPDTSGGRWASGTNFLLQLDEKSLPEGYQVIGSKSVIVRLSSGLPSKIDFRLQHTSTSK